MSYKLNLITGPASEPITLTQAKNFIKLDSDIDIDNSLIEDIFIPQARQFLEVYSKRALFTQTWELVYSCSPGSINFPLGQLQSVTSVNIVDEDDDATLQIATLYNTTLASDEGKLWLKSGSSWGTTDRLYDYFKVRFICGWDDVDNIPAKYKNAILKMVAYMNENRQYNDEDLKVLCKGCGSVKLT